MKILSRYNLFFENNNQFYLYNAQTGFLSEISEEFYTSLIENKIKEFPEEILSFLVQRGIVIEDVQQNDFFYGSKVRFLMSAYSPEVMTLVIVPTTSCNFSCPYCFEPKLNPKTITKEVENKIIEYINSQTDTSRINLTWYGGEPLLALNEINVIYDRILSECKKEISNHEMITNGFLINNEAIDFMKRSKMQHVQITIDGIESTHNKKRVLKNSKTPTYEIILNNLEKLAYEIPELNISLRVNINKENFREFIPIFKKYIGLNKFKNIHPYPGIIREDKDNHCELCQSSYAHAELIDLYEQFHNEGININFLPRRAIKGCMIQSPKAFIIGPEGELYKCWNDVSNPNKVVGSIVDATKQNNTLLLSYLNELNPFDDKCKYCNIFPICDGGCGNYRYRNLHECGRFDFCSTFKKEGNLKKSLLLSLLYPVKEGPSLQI